MSESISRRSWLAGMVGGLLGLETHRPKLEEIGPVVPPQAGHLGNARVTTYVYDTAGGHTFFQGVTTTSVYRPSEPAALTTTLVYDVG